MHTRDRKQSTFTIMAPARHEDAAAAEPRIYLLVECAPNQIADGQIEPADRNAGSRDPSVAGTGDGVQHAHAALPLMGIVSHRHDDAAPKGVGHPQAGTGAAKSRTYPDGHAAERICPKQCLTGRQYEILLAMKDGASNKEIARTMGIAESTVKVQLKLLYRRLGVRNRTQAAMIAIEHLTDQAAGRTIPDMI